MPNSFNPHIGHPSLRKPAGWLHAAVLGGGLFVVMAHAPLAHAQMYSDWSVPVNLGPVVNSAFNDLAAAISKNGLSLYITSARPGLGRNDIWVSQRPSVDAPWGAPVNLGPVINTEFDEGIATLSRDGHFMFFQSDRPDGLGGFDIWVSWRQHTHDDFGWTSPVNLGAGINSDARDVNPTYFENDEGGVPQLYFSSERLGTPDLHLSELQADGSFGPALPVAELNSPLADNSPSIRHNGLELFFQSDRLDSLGPDLWVATRESTLDAWSTPVNLGATINTVFTERFPHLSSDGETLFFESNRPGGFGRSDLYMTTRTKLRGESGK